MSEEQPVTIYVLPTESRLPPRAILMRGEPEQVADGLAGAPIDLALGEAITEHARDLGVEW